MSMMSSTTTTSMSNNFNQTTIPSESNPSLLPAIRQQQQQQQQSQHRRSHSLNFAAALNRRASKRTGSSSSTLANQSTRAAIHTLPIIQPDTYWNSYQNSRHFKISLREPRQQVTSLLALSSIPRPITPPLHEDSEPSAASLIANVTRLVMEEEATNAAIAASLQTLENEVNVNVNGLNESDELDLLSNSSSSLPPPCHDDLNEIRNPFRKLLNSQPIKFSNRNTISTSSSTSSSATSTSSYHQIQSLSSNRPHSISTNPFTS